MPDIRDILPQPPWKGPPIPKGLVGPKKQYLFSFAQPVRGGYYYIVVKTNNEGEALAIADGLDLKYKIGRLEKLSKFSLDELVLREEVKERLERFGYAHRLVTTWPPPFHERVGHYGFLPE